MKRIICYSFIFATLASCTALTQKDSYIDALPRAAAPVAPAPAQPVTVFSEDFENGLSKWNQLAGTWTTGSPGANGLALISPTGALASTFTLSTLNSIDISNLSNCSIQYDVRFGFSGTAGVYAQILFDGNLIGEFKNTSTATALSSSGQFLTRRYPLTSGTAGRLTIITAIANSTAADVRLDNIFVTCNNAPTSTNTVISDYFESGAANWALNSNWALMAGVGAGGSSAIKATNGTANSPMVATYLPNINLQGRSGCTLNYFYNQVGSTQTINSIDLYVNGQNIRRDLASAISSNVSQFLTFFEGSSTNSMRFECNIPANNGQSAPCTIDNISLTCLQ